MIDIVIPIGYCETPENTNNILPESGELRYALRSIEKHLTGVRHVYLIGPRIPFWCDNIGQIICGDKTGLENKEWNIYNKLKVCCEVDVISDPFLFMNDDHFLLKQFNAPEFPYFYDGRLVDKMKQRESAYLKSVKNTAAVIGELSQYYDIHLPMLIHKNEFRFMKMYNWLLPYSYVVKSLYCKVAKVTGVPIEDVKVPCVQSREWLLKFLDGKDYFSTSDNCFGKSMTALMEEFYPEKSKYEK